MARRVITTTKRAHSIFNALRTLDKRSVETAERVARWTIRNMQDRSGYFYYRKYPLITNKTPTLHWGQATMFAALAILLKHLESDAESKETVESAKAVA